jgi:positive regulator of sigma E activity
MPTRSSAIFYLVLTIFTFAMAIVATSNGSDLDILFFAATLVLAVATINIYRKYREEKRMWH